MARAGRPGRVALSCFSWLKAAAARRGRLRLAARVILLDPDGRVLLMRYDDGPPNGSHWTTPGGGLNEAEDYRAAALRELAEETGWSDIALLGEVARRRLTMEYGAGWCASVSASTWPGPTRPAGRSVASMPCTPQMASPRGDGGRWPNWTPPTSWSGPPGSPR